jgi:hypothetical protein
MDAAVWYLFSKTNPIESFFIGRKLARLYANLVQANATRDFCSDDLSCSNILAQCKNDTINAEKFCQCPSTAYTTNTDKQECGK